MSVFTGASGFAGRAVLQQLLARGHRVVAFDLNADGWAANTDDGPLNTIQQDERVRVVFGDVARYADVEAAAEGCDAIITAHAYFGGSRAGQRPAGSDRGEKGRRGWPSRPCRASQIPSGLSTMIGSWQWSYTWRHISSCSLLVMPYTSPSWDRTSESKCRVPWPGLEGPPGQMVAQLEMCTTRRTPPHRATSRRFPASRANRVRHSYWE